MALPIVCSKNHPWDRRKREDVQVVHADAVEVKQRDGYPGGDLVDYHCPNCGLDFTVELPQ